MITLVFQEIHLAYMRPITLFFRRLLYSCSFLFGKAHVLVIVFETMNKTWAFSFCPRDFLTKTIRDLVRAEAPNDFHEKA